MNVNAILRYSRNPYINEVQSLRTIQKADQTKKKRPLHLHKYLCCTETSGSLQLRGILSAKGNKLLPGGRHQWFGRGVVLLCFTGAILEPCRTRCLNLITRHIFSIGRRCFLKSFCTGLLLFSIQSTGSGGAKSLRTSLNLFHINGHSLHFLSLLAFHFLLHNTKPFLSFLDGHIITDYAKPGSTLFLKHLR